MTCNKQARMWGRYEDSQFNFLLKLSGVLTHDISSTETIYACFTWVKPANKHPERRWEINLLEHKEKLLSPVTWNGFHSAYTSLSSLWKTADIRHQHRGILTHSPEMSVDSAGSVVYATLIFIICSHFRISGLSGNTRWKQTDEFTKILIRSLIIVAGIYELLTENVPAKCISE
jgi:hypothetical protein